MRQQIIALCVAALAIGAGCTSPKENDTRDVTVVVAGDLHFDLPPETDQYYHVVTMNRLEGNFTFPTDSAAPGIAGETVRKLDGVILAGDMFDKARPEILTHYRSRYEMGPGEKTIHYPVYPGFGNHDIDPAVSDKGADNLLGRAFSLHYLDSILNDKLGRAERAGARLEVDVRLPENLAADVFDLAVILGNLLDNAIRGAEAAGAERPAVSLRSLREGDYLFLKVTNPSPPPQPPREGRGLGTQILTELAQRYGGDYQTEYKDGVFSAVVCLLV